MRSLELPSPGLAFFPDDDAPARVRKVRRAHDVVMKIVFSKKKRLVSTSGCPEKLKHCALPGM